MVQVGKLTSGPLTLLLSPCNVNGWVAPSQSNNYYHNSSICFCFLFILILLSRMDINMDSQFTAIAIPNRTKAISIYRLLDWTKPGKAIVVSLACIFSVFVVHLLVFSLYRCRVWIFRTFCFRERAFHQYQTSNDRVVFGNSQPIVKVSRTPSSYDEPKPEQFCNATVIELKWRSTKQIVVVVVVVLLPFQPQLLLPLLLFQLGFVSIFTEHFDS